MKQASKDLPLHKALALVQEKKKLQVELFNQISLLKNNIDQHFENFNQKLKIEKDI